MKKRLLIFGSLFSIVIMLNIPVISAIEFNSAKQEIIENFNDILEVNNKELLFGRIFKFFSKLVGVAGYLTSMVLTLIVDIIGILLAYSIIESENPTIFGIIIAFIIIIITGSISSDIFVNATKFAIKRLDSFGDFMIKVSGAMYTIIRFLLQRYLPDIVFQK